MIRTTALLFLLLLFSGQALCQEDSIPPLEQALSGILTIGVFKTGENDFVMGFGSRPKSFASIAYEKTLHMGDVFSSGSGFVVVLEGKYYIITNAHVVNAAARGEGALYAYSIQRKRYSVSIVGGDTFYDIAVLEFDEAPGPEVQPLQFSEQEPSLAQKVYAIGNPLGKYPYTITEGILSGKNRLYHRPTTGRFGFLQHTATLIWGNSGGPLVDEQGRVVGVNTWIESSERDGQNYLFSQLNFALDGQRAIRLARSIVANDGRLKRSFLGIELAATSFMSEPDSPPFLKAVLEGSPAYEALKDKVGATLTHLNGAAIVTLQDAVRLLEEISPGDSVRLTFKRLFAGQEVTVLSGELGTAQLEQVAQHFFHSYSDYGLADGPAGVLLASAKDKPLLQQFETLGAGDNWAVFKPIEGKPKYGLGSLGSMSKQGSMGLYQAQTIRDVGAIIRLCAIEGNLGAILVNEGEYAGTVGLFPQDKDFNDIKILYY